MPPVWVVEILVIKRIHIGGQSARPIIDDIVIIRHISVCPGLDDALISHKGEFVRALNCRYRHPRDESGEALNQHQQRVVTETWLRSNSGKVPCEKSRDIHKPIALVA